MGLGGPVWHASVASATRPRADRERLRLLALHVLGAVGDRDAGQWEEWSGYAFHVRRRLSAAEALTVGPVVDCRGTAEWNLRYNAVALRLPEQARQLAQQERG